MKVSIIYYSQTGRTKEMASVIGQGIGSIPNSEYKIMSVDCIDKEYLDDSKVVIVGTPSYYANMCWQIKKWFDTSKDLEGKLGAPFCTAKWETGGAGIANLNIIEHMVVKGMVVYTGGQALGKPFAHLGAVALMENDEESKTLFKIYGQRIAKKAHELFDI